MSALWPVQQAIYQRLAEDEPLQAAGYAVFDEPPENFEGPHIVIGDATEVPRNTLARRGWEGTETLHLWAPVSPRGGSSRLGRQGAELVRAALESEPLTIDGHTSARCRCEYTATLKEPGWRHVVSRYRLWTRRN